MLSTQFRPFSSKAPTGLCFRGIMDLHRVMAVSQALCLTQRKRRSEVITAISIGPPHTWGNDENFMALIVLNRHA